MCPSVCVSVCVSTKILRTTILEAWHVAVLGCSDVVMLCLIFVAILLVKTPVSGSGSHYAEALVLLKGGKQILMEYLTTSKIQM